jgi:oxygen-independent coproporphyrinogen-3 oxidase
VSDQRPAASSHLGLYVHVPFCSSICNYCNFNRGLFEPGLKARYVEALEREIRGAGRGEPVDTVYFGGGTPSLLEPAEIGRIIEACRAVFDVTRDAEVTLETNPETSTPERMAGFRAAGVNRVSFGVQSFDDAELRRLGRVHTSARASAALAEARGAGFDNVSMDLMMWLPGQSPSSWAANVATMIDAGPDHVSLYLLELYPNAPIKEEMARGGWSQAPDEDAAEMYLTGLATFESAGYGQYEISNVCREGRESRHNLKYWTDGAWLGFGCGAHSTRDGMRWKNVSATVDYVDRVRSGESVAVERHVMSHDERLGDALFTGLRLTRGVDVARIGERYGVDVWARYRTDLQPFVTAGVLVKEGDCLRLTREGMLVANEVMQIFV